MSSQKSCLLPFLYGKKAPGSYCFLWVELCSSFPIEANGHFCTCAKIINLLLCLTKGAY